MQYLRDYASVAGKAALKHALRQAGITKGKSKSVAMSKTPTRTSGGRMPRGKNLSVGVQKSRSRGLNIQPAQLQVGAIASGPSIRFGEARAGNARGMKLVATQPWCDVGQGDTVIKCLGLPGAAAGATYNNVNFDPNNATYMPDPLQSVADLFVRYRLNSITLRYAPAVPTTDTTSFAMAWLNDPDVTSTTYNTYVKIQGCQESVTFASYEPWQMRISIDDKMVRYIDNAGTQNRLQIPGILVAAVNVQGGAGTFTRKGTIYMDLDIDFFELFNVTGTSLLCACGRVCDKAALRRRFSEAAEAKRKRDMRDFLAFQKFKQGTLELMAEGDGETKREAVDEDHGFVFPERSTRSTDEKQQPADRELDSLTPARLVRAHRVERPPESAPLGLARTSASAK